jgi:indolepyruvate ferredoxin oxidoreductase alpha subunit
MKPNKIFELCHLDAGQPEVLQGNIAFAVGCVRAGIHSADGYPGTPSTEVIDRGLAQVQELITVGWSVNEAVAVGMGLGHSLAGRDVVVTMKIPGLFQAGDLFTSAAFFTEPRGALIYFIASDFTPSSTQHLVDPRYLFKTCFLPVFEPTNHQEMLEAAAIAVEVGRQFRTPVVILASGALCHSEGLVRMNPISKRAPQEMDGNFRRFNSLPGIARQNYDKVMQERMSALSAMVEQSPLNRWIKGAGKKGIITSGANTAYALEVREAFGLDVDILSLGFTNPLPQDLIRRFCQAVDGEVMVIDDGYRYLQEELAILGLQVTGKNSFSTRTEYSPALVASTLGLGAPQATSASPRLAPVNRPPMICPGCPYRLFAETLATMKRRGKLTAIFGDIGCNSLLYFLGAMDTGVAMGASEAKRAGYVLSRPEMADKVMSVLGDSTECHSGMDATRNTVFRHVPGVKVVLDNYWTAMTGGQPAPTSPVNLAGVANTFDLVKALSATGAKTMVVDAYNRIELQKGLRQAFKEAAEGAFTTLVVRGGCLKKLPPGKLRPRLKINEEKCDKCYACMICPGIETGPDGFPRFTNLCSGCGGQGHSCQQMCPFKAMEPLAEQDGPATTVQTLAEPPPLETIAVAKDTLPRRLSLAIRGVGGQGNLFFGRVLTQVAFLAGYGEDNIVKGETHGMAQMGGPVISTFACGQVHSPVLLPGEADCLIAMEVSELLRPGFLDLLRPGGTIIAARTVMVPQGMKEEDYPSLESIRTLVKDYRLIEVDVLAEALALGDATGRIANVVMMGMLSTIAPFAAIPEGVWLHALKEVTPPAAWAGNYRALAAGRKLGER